MFEILLKQLLGNVDLDAIKLQVAQFAATAAEAFNNIKDTNQRVRRIEAHLFPVNLLSDATVVQPTGESNDHDDHDEHRRDNTTAS